MTRVIDCERPPSADDRNTACGVFPNLPMEPLYKRLTLVTRPPSAVSEDAD